MQRFRQVVRYRDVASLQTWLADSSNSDLPQFVGFTRGIAADREAVMAALIRQPWSTGTVEGHVHKIKLLKRAAYGRAGLQQLRARILAARRRPTRSTLPSEDDCSSPGLRKSRLLRANQHWEQGEHQLRRDHGHHGWGGFEPTRIGSSQDASTPTSRDAAENEEFNTAWTPS